MELLKLFTKTTQHGLLILFSSSSLFIISCMGYNTSPCEGASSACIGKSIGNLNLDSSIFKTAPQQFNTSINYENNNGFQTIFSIYNNQRNYNKNFDLLYRSEPSDCVTKYCYDYISAQTQITNYISNNTPFKYEYLLQSVSTTKPQNFINDSIVKGYSTLSIIVNNDEFKLPYNRTNLNNWILLDSITINNKYYSSVYHVYLDSSLIDKTLVKPQGIYYRNDIGLIAFYLTNGETWGLK